MLSVQSVMNTMIFRNGKTNETHDKQTNKQK